MAITNKGKYRILEAIFNGGSLPATFYAALITSAAAPTVDTNTFGELTEIAAGNGYTTGGTSLSKNSTDFPTITEDDTNNLAKINVKNLTWTASGGTIPASGSGARYLILTDANATVSSREVWAWWDLGGNKSIATGQTLTIGDASSPIQIQLADS